MVSLLTAASREFPPAALRGCSDRGWRRLSIGEGAREWLRGVRVLGALTVAPGEEAARSLDTCPTPSWGPGSGPRTRLRWRLETGSPWGWKWERLRGRRRRRGGLCDGAAFRGTPERRWAEGAREVALWEARSVRMAAGVAGSRSPANCWQCLELRAALGRCVGSGDRTEKARVGGGREGACAVAGGAGRPGTFGNPLSLPRSGRRLPSSGSSTPADLASLPRDRCGGALFGGLGVTRPDRIAELGARTCLGAKGRSKSGGSGERGNRMQGTGQLGPFPYLLLTLCFRHRPF